jgi:hypothetical protein
MLDETEASSGITNSKVVDPTADDWIDKLHYPVYRLGNEASEDVFELAQQYSSLFELGRIVRPPFALQAAYAAELKTQKSEAVAFCQVNVSTLLLVDLDLEFGQFLS